MCGIFGIVVHNGDVIPESWLEETARLLQHRGPDSFGVYSEPGIGLVNTRLSLVDLSPRSDQPFWDTKGRYCIVYNGEIYNFMDLRAELERQGVQFHTTSDTEVLLASVIRNGIEATLPKLDGMFAFGVYDRVEKTLTVVRDRFGMKPLFIYDEEDCFIFASEIVALSPWITLKPDVLSISSFLSGFTGPMKGYSFVEKLKFFPPGSLATCQMGKRTQYGRFFSLGDLWDPDSAIKLRSLKPIQVVDKVEELLAESVQRHLLADAPVGALCSGGIDSSLVLAMAARTHNNLAIFHANVVGPLSEYDAAWRLARHLRLDLNSVEVVDQDFIDSIPEVTEHWGHPFFACLSAVPYLMVSRLVRSKGVKAVLSGEGADEGFEGYRWMAPDITDWQKHVRHILSKAISVFTRHSVRTDNSKVPVPNLVVSLHNRFELEIEQEEIRTKIIGFREKDKARIIENIHVFNYNLRPILHRNDSMGMAASIEARFPYLTLELMKLAVNIPYEWKIKFSPLCLDRNHFLYIDKWILRKLAERYLPKEMPYRFKRPFPVDAFHRMHISPSYLEKSFITELFGLSNRESRYLIENSDQALRIKMMQVDVWASIFLKGIPKAEISEQLAHTITVIPH